MNATALPANQVRDAGAVDEAFIRKALGEADLNALRLALYQATGDESLAEMRIEHVPARGGATTMTLLARDDHEQLKQKAVAFLMNDPEPGPKPADAELRRLMQMLTGETLSDKDFQYRRDIPAFDDFPRA